VASNLLLDGGRALTVRNLLVVNESAPLKRILVILAVNAFAIRGAQNTALKALAILFEAARLLARASLHVVLHWLYLLYLLLLLAYLRSESVWCAF
jgi:hypothetical protein